MTFKICHNCKTPTNASQSFCAESCHSVFKMNFGDARYPDMSPTERAINDMRRTQRQIRPVDYISETVPHRMTVTERTREEYRDRMDYMRELARNQNTNIITAQQPRLIEEN